MNRNPYDPPADHFARGRIGQAQFWAGRESRSILGSQTAEARIAPTCSTISRENGLATSPTTS